MKYLQLCFLAICLQFQIDAHASASIAQPYVFMDQKARVSVEGQKGKLSFKLRTITPEGWGPSQEVKGKVDDSVLMVTPLIEGIHIVDFDDKALDQVRFLAIEPPVLKDMAHLLKALPRNGRKLLSGRAFKFLAIAASGISKWVGGSIQTSVTLKNVSGQAMEGAVHFIAPYDAKVVPSEPQALSLKSGEAKSFTVSWHAGSMA